MTLANTTLNNMVREKPDLDVYIGKYLNNRYLIRDLIGKGGMGNVYLAEDVAKGGVPVALKILSVNLINQQMYQRFVREIFIGAQLGRKCKHIIKVLGYGITEEQVPFYVMEFLAGKNLKTIVKHQHLSISKFLDYCQQICLGLQCAHQGVNIKGEIYPVLHRDIKPENIFITEDSKKGEIVKILDFGIAKFLTERSGMTLTESFIGSLPYCSPEHMEGRKLLDVRSDIYSFGVLMFEMLTGKHPFASTNNTFSNWYQAHRFQIPPGFEEVNPNLKIPHQLQKLVMSCLAKEIINRPQNIQHILENLQKINKVDNNIVTASSTQLIPVTSLSEKICLQKTWPKNKPISSICFPHLLQTNQGKIPTLWAMLPQEEINNCLDNKCVEFIAQVDLYPMVLWITALSNTNLYLTRWLSYFLDFQDPKLEKIAQRLAETGYYHLLLFALEKPSNCAHVMTITLTSTQRQQLLDYLELNQSNPVVSTNEIRNILKTRYENMKPKILQQMATNSPNVKLAWKKLVFQLFNKISQVVKIQLKIS